MSQPGAKKKSLRKQNKRVFSSFFRFNAEVRNTRTKKVTPCRALLPDLSKQGVALFLSEKLKPGSRVSVCIHRHEGNFLVIPGIIKWCKHHHYGSKIMASDPFPFRAEIKFDFQDPEMEKALCQFLSQALSLIT